VTYRFLFLDGRGSVELGLERSRQQRTDRSSTLSISRRAVAADRGARLCVLLDMGRRQRARGSCARSYSDRRLVDIFFDAAKAAGFRQRTSDVRHEEIRDDHLSFMNIGIPSIDLIDFDLRSGATRNWAHGPQDTARALLGRKVLAITGRIVLGGSACVGEGVPQALRAIRSTAIVARDGGVEVETRDALGVGSSDWRANQASRFDRAHRALRSPHSMR